MKHKKGEYMFWIRCRDNLGGVFSFSEKTEKKAMTSFKSMSKKGYHTAIYREVAGFHSTTQIEYLILWHSPKGTCFWGYSLNSDYVTDKEQLYTFVFR